jgi:hypothetical protein
VTTISIESLENSMDFSRQENLLELEESGILSYTATLSKVFIIISKIFIPHNHANPPIRAIAIMVSVIS